MKEHRATAEHMVAKGECEEAIPFLTESIEVSPWNVQLREMRAQCFETVGNYQSAISDIKWVCNERDVLHLIHLSFVSCSGWPLSWLVTTVQLISEQVACTTQWQRKRMHWGQYMPLHEHDQSIHFIYLLVPLTSLQFHILLLFHSPALSHAHPLLMSHHHYLLPQRG